MVTEGQGATAETVGAEIRRLRETSGWSLEALAAELKIAPRQLAALEAGQWQALPGAVFVRGVVKGVARWAGRDPEPWLAAVARVFGEQTVDLIPPRNAEGEIVERGAFWRRPLFRFAVGALLIASLLAGYLQWFGVWESGATRDSGGSMVAVTPLIAPNGERGEPEPQREPLREPSGDEGAHRAEPAVPAAPAEAAANGALPKGGGEAVEKGLTTTPSSRQPVTPILPERTLPSGSPPAGGGVQQPQPPAQAGEAEARGEVSRRGLLVRAEHGDSWLRITAADGKVVYDGVLRQGSHRLFPPDGAPYSLHIGNAKALLLEWEGRALALPGPGVVRMQVPGKP